MKYNWKLGITDRTVLVFVQDSSSTTGAGKAGVTHTMLTGRYIRVETDNDVTISTITMAAITNLTDAHADGGWKEIDATNAVGWYRFDIPDGAFAAGAWSVGISLQDAGSNDIAPVPIEIQLVAYDPEDAGDLGLTNLDATVSSRASQTSVDTIDGIVDTITANVTTALNRIGAFTGSGVNTILGFFQAIMRKDVTTPSDVGGAYDDATDSLEAQRDNVGTAGAGLTSADDAVLAAIAALNNLSSAQAQTAANAALVALHLDHLVLASGTVAVAGGSDTQHVISEDLPAAAENNDYYNGCVVVFTSGQNIGTARKVNDHDWSSGLIHDLIFTGTGNAWPVTPADGDAFIILAVADEQMRGTNSAALASSYTATRAGYLDLINSRLDTTVSSRSSHSAADVWSSGTRTLTSFGTLVADTVAAVWAALTSGLTTVGSIGKLIVDNLNATISSRASQTSVDDLPTNAELATALGTADDATLAAISTLSTKVGTPAGVSVSADIAAVKAETASIQTDTNSIETKIDTLDTNVDTIVTNVAAILDDTGTSGVVLTAAERTAIATALLKIDMSTITGEAARSPINALRTLRNKVTIVGTTITVYEEDDTTTAWTGTITTDAAANPITAVDPA